MTNGDSCNHSTQHVRRPQRDIYGHTQTLQQFTLHGYFNTSINRCRMWHICKDGWITMFNKTVENSNHVLHTILPPPSVASQHYNLRRCTHSLSLPDHDNYLSDCNFITPCVMQTVPECYKVLTVQFLPLHALAM